MNLPMCGGVDFFYKLRHIGRLSIVDYSIVDSIVDYAIIRLCDCRLSILILIPSQP